MFKPLPTSPTSPRSSHSPTPPSRPLTASSRASELSYFSQYSVDELARRIFFRIPPPDEVNDGETTPKGLHMSSISQALGAAAAASINHTVPSDFRSKPLPPEPQRESIVPLLSQPPPPKPVPKRSPIGDPPNVPLPPTPPPRRLEFQDHASTRSSKRHSMLDYFRPRSRDDSNNSLPTPVSSKRHSSGHFDLRSFLPQLQSPPPLHTSPPRSPAFSQSSRSRPVSLPPSSYMFPSEHHHPIHQHVRFPSHTHHTQMTTSSRAPVLGNTINATVESGDQKMSRSGSILMPKVFLMSILLLPWYWLLSQLPTRGPTLDHNNNNNTRASSVLLPDLLMGGAGGLPIARKRAGGGVDSPHSPQISVLPTSPLNQGESDRLIGQVPERGRRGRGRDLRERGRGGCGMITAPLFTALGAVAITWGTLGGRS